jgi:hypothetical protein
MAVVAVWLLLHNPTVKSTSLGHYTCSASYDSVLLDADNVPGGEPSADADEVEARCIDAGKAWFTGGFVAGAAAVPLAAVATVVAVRRQTAAKQRDAAQETLPRDDRASARADVAERVPQ